MAEQPLGAAVERPHLGSVSPLAGQDLRRCSRRWGQLKCCRGGAQRVRIVPEQSVYGLELRACRQVPKLWIRGNLIVMREHGLKAG